MLPASPGFITVVDTLMLGSCTMLARVPNPGRIFANMRFKVPWNRAPDVGSH